MSIDFMAAMRRATEATRALDVAGATRIIRQALGGRAPDAADPPEPAPDPFRRGVPEVEDAEVVEPRPRPAKRRRPLSEVVRQLREGRFAVPGLEPQAPHPTAPPPIPQGASFDLRRHACAAGSRAYRLYVPATAAQGIEGLVVMLHGCTQTPEDFALGTGMNRLAERHRLVVAYPAQAAVHNPKACWNWFRREDQARGAGEPAIIAGLTTAIAAEFDVAPGHVFVAGLSAGGAMAAVMGETYPELYAAVGVHSGLAPGAASDVASAFAAMRQAPAATAAPAASRAPRIIVFHGDADQTVHPSNAAQVLAHSAGSEARTERARVGMNGHRGAIRTVVRRADGRAHAELWLVEGAGHAWCGGDPAGSYTDPSGPDASAEMVRFFLEP